MQISEPVKFKGVPGSPYTRKMLAYLRFRHIRYQLLIGDQINQSDRYERRHKDKTLIDSKTRRTRHYITK